MPFLFYRGGPQRRSARETHSSGISTFSIQNRSNDFGNRSRFHVDTALASGHNRGVAFGRAISLLLRLRFPGSTYATRSTTHEDQEEFVKPAIASCTFVLFCLVSGFAQITGSGTKNFIPRFTGTTTVENSNIYESPANHVGIGTKGPHSKLSVSGSDATVNGMGAAVEISNTASGGGNWYLRSGATGTGTPAGGFSIANDAAYFLTFTSGGQVGLNNNAPTHNLDMSDGAYENGGTWTNNSDRNLKDGFTSVDGASLLSKLNGISIQIWHYKADGNGVRHLGPVAQDFYNAFGLGQDDKHISTVDEGGVALAAVQELYRQNLEKDSTIQKLSQEVQELKKAQVEMADLETRLARLEHDQQSLSATGSKRPARTKSGDGDVALQARTTLPTRDQR